MLGIGLTLLLSFSTPAALVSASGPPSVRLDSGTFNGALTGDVANFLGIPFAQPPVGNLRLRYPVPNSPYSGTHDASAFGPACIQQNSPTTPIPSILDPAAQQTLQGILDGAPLADSEDCLTINVIKPANVTQGAKLPVLFWIYGGGFEQGGTAAFNGTAVVERSIQIGVPAIFVSANYRLTALGFLAGKEVKAAGLGNIGLHDQRQALRWVQQYIGAFGGDPTKVTIWGESAGAYSVGLQMVTNGGNPEGLFRAAFMQSGSPPRLGDITGPQALFDTVVSQTGCSGASDKIQCLRTVPLSTLRTAINASPPVLSYSSLNIVWQPVIDGAFVPDDPQRLVQQGKIAKVPFVSGDCDDEGTLFSWESVNITTDQEVHDYIKQTYFPLATDAQITQLLTLYPSDPTQGSPFDTGTANAVTPQYKRIAALQGDIIFQAPRRFLLEQLSGKQTTYAFLSKRSKSLPDLGSFHSTDISNIFGPGDLTDYLVRFGATLNPNGNTNINWPVYTNGSPQLVTFLDGATPQIITQDTFRGPAIQYVSQLDLATLI